MPGDESGPHGFGILETKFVEFEFTADVTDVKCYQLEFGDEQELGDDVEPKRPTGADGRTVRTHRYTKPGSYTAVMRAWRLSDSDDDREVDCDGDLSELPKPIRLPLEVRVNPPRPVPQPAPSSAQFSVTPSDPTDPIIDDIEVTWADFTFTAHVSQAKSYELAFGDEVGDVVVESDIKPNSAGEAVRRHHRYEMPGDYTAVMRAQRNTDELVKMELPVSVHSPAPAASLKQVSVQWPPVRPVVTVPPEPAKSNILLWLLFLAAIAILLSMGRGLTAVSTGTDDIKFEPRSHRGKVTLIDSTTANDAVSMCVHRDEGRPVISVDNGERQ